MATEKKPRRTRKPKACTCIQCTKVQKNAKLLAKVRTTTCLSLKK